MIPKSFFTHSKFDLQMVNQANNFEDACNGDDLQGLHRSPSQSFGKESNHWHSLPSFHAPLDGNNQPASTTGSPSATPQGSPATFRKQLDPLALKKRWFNPHLFPVSSESDNINSSNRFNSKNAYIFKRNPYKDVSNFDINAIGPISF